MYIEHGKSKTKNALNRKNPDLRVVIVTLIAVVGISAVLVSCQNSPASSSPSPVVSQSATPSPTPSASSSEPILYKNENFGITLTFPAEWKDRYLVMESGNWLYVYSKKVNEAGKDGQVQRILRMTGELITDDDILFSDLRGKILLKGNGYTYISSTGNGLGISDTSNAQLFAEYQDMFNKSAAVYQSIKLLGTKTPVASNAGYKVIGSSFFTAEIPGDMTVKASAGTFLRWDIYSGASFVGSFDAIPCYSERLSSDSKTLRDYVLDDSKDKYFDVSISLSKDSADQSVMDKIKSSLKLLPYQYTVLTSLSQANKCVAEGGSKIFGKIVGFDRINITTFSANIRKMQYISDSSSKGFHIEDSNQSISYQAVNVMLVPLAGPDYKTYGLRGVDTIIYGGNYSSGKMDKDHYYDFIIDKDGKLRFMLERYIP